jgi:hypothetical protein
MTRIVVFACAIVALVAVQARAADQTMKAKSPKAEFTLSSDLMVGTTTLKPGIYKFQCVTMDDADYLVVTSEDGKEVARVPCTPEALKTKNDVSDFRFMRRPDGVAQLTGVRIRGEKVGHVVVATN